MLDIFLSYDGSDEYWRARFDDVFGHGRHYRSVRPADMPAQGGAFYASELISKGYITPDTVTVVLIGPRTFSSAKVDWEISAALGDGKGKVGGLLAVRLPNHPDYQKPAVNPKRLPVRIADNLKSGFLRLHDWTESEHELESRLYSANRDARTIQQKINNERALLARDILR